MDSETPANRSRIPRVLVNSVQAVRSNSIQDMPLRNGKVPDGGAVPKGLSSSARTNLKDSCRSGQNLGATLKRPIENERENAPNAKKRATAPPSSSKEKLPPWDFKGKLKLAEERIARLKDQLQKTTSEYTSLKSENGDLKQNVDILTLELTGVTSTLESTTRQLFDTRAEIENVQLKCTESERLQRSTALTLQNANQALSLKEERLAFLTAELEELKASQFVRETSFSTLKNLLAEKEGLLKHLQDEREILNGRVKDLELNRKVLHNTVMELKGNIRVFCRVRPFIPTDTTQSKSLAHMTFSEDNSIEVFKGPKRTNYSFTFDRVFSLAASQEDIFGDLSELIQSVLDGYHVCVFAYGQTGSGKTYTMEGGFGQDRGMIPLSVDLIFERLQVLESVGFTSQVEASFLEVYNEQIKDLLGSSQSDKPCEIRNPTYTGGDMVVTNLRVEVVGTAREVNDLLNIARTNRAVASTVHNDHSSRSHFVFKLSLRITNLATGKGTSSTLSLVDLAGSERLVDIKENERVQETKYINKSLSNVGNVILALSQKKEHIPYRNSKLTHLLQPCLGGNSKTLMLVTLSPREECLDETLNSLRFASRVNECHVGRAKPQVQ